MSVPLFQSAGPVVIDETGAPVPAPAEEPAPVAVTVECDQPGCQETFTGPSSGPLSAGMLMGRHRYAVHGVKGTGKRRRGSSSASSSPATAVEAPTPARAVAEGVAEVAAQVGGTGVPRAPAIAGALGRGLSIATLMAANWAVDSDPLIQQQEQIDPDGTAARKAALARVLSLSEESARAIAAPVSRLLAPTELNKRYGRAVVENSDWAPAAVAVVELGRHWAEFLAIRRQHVAAIRAQTAAAAGGPRPPVAAPVPPPAPAAGVTVPPQEPAGPMGSGRIATPTYRTQ